MTLVLLGLKHEALALKLCFHGLLRISEALMLRGEDIVWPTDGSHAAVLLLGLTKRGRDQKVTVQDASTLSWLAAFFKDQTVAGKSRVCTCSYNQVRRAITVASQHFGLCRGGLLLSQLPPLWRHLHVDQGGAIDEHHAPWPVGVREELQGIPQSRRGLHAALLEPGRPASQGADPVAGLVGSAGFCALARYWEIGHPCAGERTLRL